MNRTERLRELYARRVELRRQQETNQKEIDEVRRGCGRPLRRNGPDDWQVSCGFSDYGSDPLFCTECGGEGVLADQASDQPGERHEYIAEGAGTFVVPSIPLDATDEEATRICEAAGLKYGGRKIVPL